MSPPDATRRILMVEDDAKIADMLANYLQMHGFVTDWCADGQEALARVRRQVPALLLST